MSDAYASEGSCGGWLDFGVVRHPLTSSRLVALAIGLIVLFLGVALRVQVLRSPSGWLNADEATMGLMAMDILHGRFPIVLEGQAYSAALESYLFAPFVGFIGAHVVALKLVPIAFWALASILMVGAARRVMGLPAAVLAGALTWLAPGALLVLSTQAYPGYALGLAIVVATLWSLLVSADQAQPDPPKSALVGGLAGLAVYVHPMFLSVVVPGVLVVSMRHYRQFRRWWAPASAAAVAVNIPLIVWNLSNGFRSLENTATHPASYSERLIGFFEGLMPRGLGLMSTSGEWIFSRSLALAAYALVLLLVAAGAVALARRGWSGLVLVAMIVLVWPLMALFSAHGYVLDGRYAIIPLAPMALCIAAAVDEASAFLLRKVRRADQTASGEPVDVEVAAVSVSASNPWRLTAFIAITVGTLWLVLAMTYLDRSVGPAVEDPNGPVTALIDYLDETGFDRVSGSYWVIQRVGYMTGGRIPGAVDPAYYPVRSPRLQHIVETSPFDRVAFVYTPDDEEIFAPADPTQEYRREIVGGFVVYLPAAPG